MALLLKQEHELAVLQLALDRSDPVLAEHGGEAVFTVELSQQIVFESRCDSAELGLLQTTRQSRQYRDAESEYRIPEHVLKGIAAALDGKLSPGVPLWLQFHDHCGNLTLLPWERLLLPSLQTSILRLPYFTLKPFSAAESCLDIVICATTRQKQWSFPIETVLETLAYRIFDVVHRPMVAIHIFSDSHIYPLLNRVFRKRQPGEDNARVFVYNPDDARAYSDETDSSETDSSDSGTPSFLENPWLRWISASLGGRSADVVHFIGQYYVSSEQGNLCFSESPVATSEYEVARYVSPQQLATFAQYLGAWSLGLTVANHRVSGAGLRLLGDQVARRRPGPVLLHELQSDPQLDAAAAAYQFLYNAEQDTLPALPAIALYCHPARVRELAMSRDIRAEAAGLREFTLAYDKGIEVLSSSHNTPVWIASSQRYLEQSAARLLNESASSSAAEPVQEGEQEALRLVAEVLRRHMDQPTMPDARMGARGDKEGMS